MKINILILFCLFHLVSFSQEINDHSVLLKQIVLTAQYTPTHIDSSIYLVDIINKNELTSFGAQNLSSVLNRKLGIDVFHDPFLGNYIDFQGISGENIKVLISSNIKIDDLYKDGLQRDQFLPFIHIIKKNSVQKELIIDEDYRKSGSNKLHRAFFPTNEKNKFKISL